MKEIINDVMNRLIRYDIEDSLKKITDLFSFQDQKRIVFNFRSLLDDNF